LIYSYALSFVTCYSCSTLHSTTCSIFFRRSCCSHCTCESMIWSSRFSSSFIWIRRCFYHSLRYSSCYPSHFTWSTSLSYIDFSRSQIWSTDTSTTPAATLPAFGGFGAPAASTTPAGAPPAFSLGGGGLFGAKRENGADDSTAGAKKPAFGGFGGFGANCSSPYSACSFSSRSIICNSTVAVPAPAPSLLGAPFAAPPPQLQPLR
jgi:hypothetical protein